jgi:hypothetical protein
MIIYVGRSAVISAGGGFGPAVDEIIGAIAQFQRRQG